MASCEDVDRQRLELEQEVMQLDKEYREGELTKRGWGKRKAALQLKLLDLDYKEGDLTDQGFEKKKKLIQQIDDPCTVDSEIKELGDFESKMPTTLTKLFGRNRQSLKTAVTAKPKKEEKFYRYEVYCLPKGATDIPRGNTRSFIPKAVIEIRRSDLATAIRKKIHLLFPEFFSEDKEEAQYCYLKATSNKLVKMTSPPTGHQTFNGNALVALCGQGQCTLSVIR